MRGLTPAPESSEARTRRRAATAAFSAILLYFVGTAIAGAIVQGEVWDLRLFQHDALDATWRLELSWRAWRGEWSGIDFQYPRGPLWQLYGLVATHVGRRVFHDSVGWPLALLDLGFHLTTLGAIAWVTLRPPTAKVLPRLLALLALCLLSRVTGSATLRGFLPLLVVLVYAPPDLARGDAPLWRAPLLAAALTMVATLFGFDRLYSAGLCVAALAVAEILIRWRRDDRPKDGVTRALLYGAGCVVGLLLIGLAQAALGGDPIGALRDHSQLSAAYAAHMSMPWRTGVPRAVIATLFVAVSTLAFALGRRRDPKESLAGALWLVGATPAATFALMRADAGHLILSLLPAFGALIVVSAGRDARVTQGVRRIAAGVAALALFGWLATHPAQVAGDPRILVELTDVVRGTRAASAGHRTDYGNALRWARARFADEPADACLAVSADMTFLHPALDRGGPTELSLRWSDEMKRALADRIERAACPYFVYWGHTRDEPRLTWSFGEDFVRVAQLYEFDSPAGVAIHGLRLREAPLELERVRVAEAQRAARMPAHEERRIALTQPVRAGDLVTLEVTMDVERWRLFAGGAPRVEWRFERDGQSVGEWDRLYGLSYGRPSRVHVSPNARLTELAFIAEREPPDAVVADALVLRVAPSGIASPEAALVTVGAIELLRLLPPEPLPTPQCDAHVDLALRLAEGRGHAQHGSPEPTLDYFDLDPTEPERYLPEVVFPVTPCPGTCVRTDVVSRLPRGHGDGAVAEIFVRDGDERVHIGGTQARPGRRAVTVEASLEDWAHRPIELALSAWPGAQVGEDALRLQGARLGPCAARRPLAGLLREGVARAVEGDAAAVGDDVEIRAPGGVVRVLLRAIRDTCLESGFALIEADSDARAWMSVRVADGDVEHVLAERVVGPGSPVMNETAFLTEFATRDVELIFEARVEGGGAGAHPRLVAPRFVRCAEGP